MAERNEEVGEQHFLTGGELDYKRRNPAFSGFQGQIGAKWGENYMSEVGKCCRLTDHYTVKSLLQPSPNLFLANNKMGDRVRWRGHWPCPGKKVGYLPVLTGYLPVLTDSTVGYYT